MCFFKLKFTGSNFLIFPEFENDDKNDGDEDKINDNRLNIKFLK